MKRTFNVNDFDEWILPVLCAKEMLDEIGESSDFGGAGRRSGLAWSVVEVLDACIDAARQRFAEAIKEAGEEAQS